MILAIGYLAGVLFFGWLAFSMVDPYGHQQLSRLKFWILVAMYSFGWPLFVAYLAGAIVWDAIRRRM